MPLWIIYHPPTTFTTSEEKTGLANAITSIYTAASLPAFYVNVIFSPVEANNYYIGGVQRPSAQVAGAEPGPDPEKPWIRVTIQNIARTLQNDAHRDKFLAKIDEALKPFIEDKGYDWEYSVEETRRDLWKVQGLVPPMPRSKAEVKWVEENKPSLFKPEDGGL